MRIATLFSGIGAPEQAAQRVYGEDLEMVFACEWDKFARQSFKANYNIDDEHFHKDVNDLDGNGYKGKVDILIGGSPCQAFSIAGLRNGTDDERGQLIYQYIRVVDEVRAPVIVYENVKGMMSIGGGRTIKEFVQALREIGYYCHYEVVNTKDYGVPQNRERIFLVGFLNNDHYHRFQFAPKIKLEKRLKDILESDVDEKYCLSDKMVKCFEGRGAISKGYEFKPGGTVANCLTVKYGNYSTDSYIKVEGLLGCKGTDQIRRVYCTDGIDATLTTMQGGNQEPKIVASRGRNPSNPSDRTPGANVEQRLEVNESGTSNALTTVQKDNYVLEHDYRIRKLTPRECLRLQDFPDAFKQVVSDSQQYKQAGNSMSVNVLEMIFKQIEIAKSEINTGTLMDFI